MIKIIKWNNFGLGHVVKVYTKDKLKTNLSDIGQINQTMFIWIWEILQETAGGSHTYQRCVINIIRWQFIYNSSILTACS